MHLIRSVSTANTLSLHRLKAWMETEIHNPKRVLEKLGFAREGTLRECEIKKGKFISLHLSRHVLKHVALTGLFSMAISEGGAMHITYTHRPVGASMLLYYMWSSY